MWLWLPTLLWLFRKKNEPPEGGPKFCLQGALEGYEKYLV